VSLTGSWDVVSVRDRQHRHSVSVAGVVVDGDRVLTIRRADTGAVQLPGGVLEMGESIHAGLVREVVEETGVQVAPEALTGVYKHAHLAVVALVFRCRVVSGVARSTEESTRTEWMDIKNVRDRMDTVFAIRVEDALSHGSHPAIRTHDGEALLD
jgi:8-oxo-dGTP diphosphatase